MDISLTNYFAELFLEGQFSGANTVGMWPNPSPALMHAVIKCAC